MLKQETKRIKSFRMAAVLLALVFSAILWKHEPALMVEASGGNKTVVGSGGNTTVTTQENTGGQENNADQEEGAVLSVNSSQVLTAKVKEQVRVRKGAGTNYDVAGSAPGNIQVTVSGEATDSEGKLWYQVSFNEGGTAVNGFIREDFLEVLETAASQPQPEEPVEVIDQEPEAAPVNEDYYLKYMENEAGEGDWYLFDQINGTSQSLTELLNAVAQIQENSQTENKQISTMKIIIIAMAVVLVLLVVAVTVLLFKFHDSYEEYEEDEDEEEEEEDDEEEDELPVRPLKSRLSKRSEQKQETRTVSRTRSPRTEERESSQTKGNKAWQSKDFLELDDDMEFEFLDL